MCCTVLYHAVPYCAALYRAALCCALLYCTVLSCAVLCCAVLYCTYCAGLREALRDCFYVKVCVKVCVFIIDRIFFLYNIVLVQVLLLVRAMLNSWLRKVAEHRL
jgi:hypothetical protein